MDWKAAQRACQELANETGFKAHIVLTEPGDKAWRYDIMSGKAFLELMAKGKAPMAYGSREPQLSNRWDGDERRSGNDRRRIDGPGT